jgi:D-alanyl-D-alanine carboxypeptidase/D-alanyl-D-alanine-endopeptidase (penicillin-binding protein 4)
VDELYFNEGFTRVVVRGGSRPGDSASVRTAPARTYPRVRSRIVTTVRSAGVPLRQIRVVHDSADAGMIVVTGTVAAEDSVIETITILDHAAAYLEALREAVAERGIVVDSGVESRVVDRARRSSADSMSRQSDTTPPPGSPDAGSSLFSMRSPPLREILPPFLKPSQNQIGEILLKTLGLTHGGAGRADSGAAVVRRQLLEWGAAPDGFVIRDGSGLSRHDLVTPETIVRVLSAIRSDTAFRAFYDALPVAGVDGTVSSRMRGTAAQGNVHAKTGSLDMARSLSGYVTTADGRLLIFSILGNNWLVPASQVTAVQDAIAVRLAQLRLGR